METLRSDVAFALGVFTFQAGKMGLLQSMGGDQSKRETKSSYSGKLNKDWRTDDCELC